MIKSRNIRLTGHVARMGRKKKKKKMNACRLLVGNPEGKIPLGRPRRRWVVIILKGILERIGWYGL
jgi:hypothetical protein